MQIHNGVEKRLEKYVKNPTNFPNKFLIHHTGGTNSNPLQDTSAHTFAGVKNWHVVGRGWDTIGYHFFIEKNGKITQGRPVGMHGAHCKEHNKQSIGVCLAGNFDATMPTEAQKKALQWLLKKLSKQYDIHVAEPHRKYANKTCYGRNLTDTWAQEILSQVDVERQVCFKSNDIGGMIKYILGIIKK